MGSVLEFTLEAASQLKNLAGSNSKAGVYKQVLKALGYLEVNPKHKSLHTHEYSSLKGENGEKIFEAYAQNNTPGAYRIFWHYGPDRYDSKKKRVPVITIIAITPHP